ncbi:hypothetical protein BCR35DRAFT_308354 [Leucosporidium creatinivorum]|uniref:Uncharacterized protein n=1 Tax=Leucosporidium creatinivorum TaxID=106004 RepID=A0A1Y2E5S8_9BASI|nr:hypothetical protein BCR35DRAFT_308354 [Leucosporidium creatinivorum]
MRLLPSPLLKTLKAWRLANLSPFSLELETLYQLGTASDWALLASQLDQLVRDYDLIDACAKWAIRWKLEYFWTEGEREAIKLRERIRVQLVWAREGQFVLYQQRNAFLRRRLQEDDIVNLNISEDEKIARILSQLQPLSEVERPLTLGERLFCEKHHGLVFPRDPADSPTTPLPSTTAAEPSAEIPPPSPAPAPSFSLRRRKAAVSYSRLAD